MMHSKMNDTVAPVANRVGEIVKDGADRGLVAWEQFGRREFIEGVRHPCYQSSICAVFDDFADTIGDGRNGINRLFGGRSHGVSCVS
jgi:hypothetical protein